MGFFPKFIQSEAEGFNRTVGSFRRLLCTRFQF